MTRAPQVCEALALILVLTTVADAKRAHGKSESTSACSQCDKSKCPVIGPVPVQYCPPTSIVRDACGCCERCTALIVVPTLAAKAQACTNITCPSRQICMVNIQGLPVCRCPTEQMCRDFSPRPGKVCASEGSSLVTFPSECHMRVTMCQYSSRKIKMLYRGSCHDVSRIDDIPASAAAKFSKGREISGWAEQLPVVVVTTTAATAAVTTPATTATTAPTTTTAAATTPSKTPSVTIRTTLKTTAATIPSTMATTTTQAAQLATLEAVLHTNVEASPQHVGGRGRGRSQKVQDPSKKREGGRRDRAAAVTAMLQSGKNGHAVRHSSQTAKSHGVQRDLAHPRNRASQR